MNNVNLCFENKPLEMAEKLKENTEPLGTYA
jgi:hypothetical protein